jgi:uncharacterized protein (TIGR02145 family)
MKKNLFFSIWLLLSLCMAAVSFSSCGKEEEEDPRDVLINGVRWATCNVDAPGKFAAKPESPGMFYQWNRKKGWSATGEEVTGWNSSLPTGDSWEKENDPSPAGYRVPTFDEIETLLDETKVTNEWTTVNKVKGRKFTDKNNGNSIFLPAVGYRDYYDGTLGSDGARGNYWSSTVRENDEDYAYKLYFYIGSADWSIYTRYNGLSIRPVAK